MVIGLKGVHKNVVKQMKIITIIVLMITNLMFTEQGKESIQATGATEGKLHVSSTIDLERFEKFYIPIKATTMSYYNSDNIKIISEKPPLSALRIGWELLAGTVSGICTAKLTISQAGLKPDIYGTSIVFGYFFGYVIGNSLGVYLVGNIGNNTGSLIAAILGSIHGAVYGSLIGMIIGNKNIFIATAVAGPPVFSTILFNKSRKYRRLNQSSGLTNIYMTKKPVSFDFPDIYLSKLPLSNIFSANLEVVSVNF